MGIIPTEVFCLKLADFEIKYRVTSEKSKTKLFSDDLRILHKRIQNCHQELLFLENYYQDLYRNCYYLNPRISKWGVYEEAKKFIFNSRK